MSQRASVLKICGEPAALYLDRKHRGGESNQKGGKYESSFIVYQIALAAQAFLNNGTDPEIEPQSYSFVDDVVITVEAAKEYKGFQLKDVDRLTWEKGKHPIAKDFLMQHDVCKEEGYERIQLAIVTSKPDVAAGLKAATPKNIEPFSDVQFFPSCETPFQLLPDYAHILEALRCLAKEPECTHTECANIATLLAGKLLHTIGKFKVSEFLEAARACSPQIIRPLKGRDQILATLRPACKEILDNVPGFTYSLERGFLIWKFSIGATVTSGSLPYDCFDPRFEKVQALIEKALPKSYDDLEGLLI